MNKLKLLLALCLSSAALSASATEVCGLITVGGFTGSGPRGTISRAIPILTLADGRSYEVGLDPQEPDLNTFNREREVVMHLVGMGNQTLCLNTQKVFESQDARPGAIVADAILGAR